MSELALEPTENLHIDHYEYLEVKYLKKTAKRPNRTKIKYPDRGRSHTLEFEPERFKTPLHQAVAWLRGKGVRVHGAIYIKSALSLVVVPSGDADLLNRVFKTL